MLVSFSFLFAIACSIFVCNSITFLSVTVSLLFFFGLSQFHFFACYSLTSCCLSQLLFFSVTALLLSQSQLHFILSVTASFLFVCHSFSFCHNFTSLSVTASHLCLSQIHFLVCHKFKSFCLSENKLFVCYSFFLFVTASFFLSVTASLLCLLQLHFFLSIIASLLCLSDFHFFFVCHNFTSFLSVTASHLCLS